MGRASRRKHEKRQIQLQRPEIERALEEHLGFLFRSALSYDEGYEDEAKRLAVSLRAILHNTAQSHSLLAQLDLGSKLFTDTAAHIDPRNLGNTPGLVIMEMIVGVGVTYVAPLGMLSPSRIHPPAPFQAWWDSPVMKIGEHLWSRKQLVLALANKDGGAHVDPSLDEDYYALSRRNLLGVTYVDASGAQEAQGNPAAAAVRQIAYEVLGTFEREQPNTMPKNAKA
ncbi:hypothetical protein V6U89_14480 [Micromonospora sp. CPCC 206171]|uniref:hypothetical protein n=1 Tax=Micromonospora sp. CPCC 206171 TaxID=3122405 RepID=UPI002FF0654F